MADIQERTDSKGKTRYTARVRVKGHKPQVATFDTKTAAVKWAAKTKTDLQEGKHLPTQEAKRRTLAELIDRYIETELPKKSASTQHGQGIQLAYWRKELGHMTLSSLTPIVIADERERLLKGTTYRGTKRSGATVIRYLAVLSHCLSHARKELGWIQDNPVLRVSKPEEAEERNRCLSDEELDTLLEKCRLSRNKCLYDIVVLLLTTAARRKEITHLQWKHVHLDRRVIVLTETKNGDPRVIPIRGEAETILQKRSKIRQLHNPYVFAGKRRVGQEPRPVDIQSAWDLAVERAKLEDFRMHDLRHTAASHLAMSGATLAQLSEVLGHKTLQMVKRYINMTEGHTGDLMEQMSEHMFNRKKKGEADEKAQG